MSTYSRLYRCASTPIRTLCGGGVRPSSIFGTIKARMGATHFLTRTMPKVATEMALAVLAHNFT